MSQQQSPENVSIDDIPVDIDNTKSAEVDSADVPDKIESITRGLAREHPLTNPLIVLKATRWYIHGKGGTDPRLLVSHRVGAAPRDPHAHRRRALRRLPRVLRHGRLR